MIKIYKPVLSLGVDLSATATGVVMLSYFKGAVSVCFEEEIKPVAMIGISRADYVAGKLMELIDTTKPNCITVEGYSLNLKNANSVIPLIEIGSVFRYNLFKRGISWLDPSAGQLKTFATGKGNSPKDKVMMHVYKTWGFESSSNNVADAYVLARIGLSKRVQGMLLKDYQYKVIKYLNFKCN